MGALEGPAPESGNNPDPNQSLFPQGSLEFTPERGLAVLSGVISKITNIIGCERVLVLLLDPQEDRFKPLQSSIGFSEDELLQFNFPLSGSISGHIVKERIGTMVTDLADYVSPEIRILSSLGAESIVAAPLLYTSRDEHGGSGDSVPIGVVIGVNPEDASDATVGMLTTLSQRVSQLISFADYLPKAQSAFHSYQTAIRSVPVGVAFINSAGVIFEVNPAMSIIGLTESVKGLPYSDVFRGGIGFIKQMIERSLDSKTNQERELEIPVAKADGTEEKRFLRIQVQPSMSEDGQENRGIIVAVIDITSEQQDEALTSAILSAMSHDLRTPVTAILGSVETLKILLEGNPDEDVAEFLDVIQVQGERMVRQVSDLLDGERIARGHSLELQKSAFDLIEAIKMPVRIQRTLSTRNNFEIISDVDSLNIYADKECVDRVLTNYLTNADKYSKYSSEKGTIKVHVKILDGFVRVAVEDQGVGIPEDQLKKLFARLFRVDSHGHKGIKGTGLGLYLCKHLIELHGGEVGVESTYQQGSTFWFTLPLESPKNT